MKNILYICSKNQYDWDAFIPQQVSSPTEQSTEEQNISVLLLQDGIPSDNIPTSHISVLEGEGGNASGSKENISYQQFLEKVFEADLALVV